MSSIGISLLKCCQGLLACWSFYGTYCAWRSTPSRRFAIVSNVGMALTFTCLIFAPPPGNSVGNQSLLFPWLCTVGILLIVVGMAWEHVVNLMHQWEGTIGPAEFQYFPRAGWNALAKWFFGAAIVMALAWLWLRSAEFAFLGVLSIGMFVVLELLQGLNWVTRVIDMLIVRAWQRRDALHTSQ